MTGFNGYSIGLRKRKRVINKLDEAAKNCCNPIDLFAEFSLSPQDAARLIYIGR